MRVFCTPLFSPSQYLSIVFSSPQSVISEAMYQITPNVIWCLCTPMRVVFVKQHGHSLTAGVKIQPSSLCDECT